MEESGTGAPLKHRLEFTFRCGDVSDINHWLSTNQHPAGHPVRSLRESAGVTERQSPSPRAGRPHQQSGTWSPALGNLGEAVRASRADLLSASELLEGRWPRKVVNTKAVSMATSGTSDRTREPPRGDHPGSHRPSHAPACWQVARCVAVTRTHPYVCIYGVCARVPSPRAT